MPTTKKPDSKILGCGDGADDEGVVVAVGTSDIGVVLVVVALCDKHVVSVVKSHVSSGGKVNTADTENRAICSCSGAKDIVKADADVTCKSAFGAKATDDRNA